MAGADGTPSPGPDVPDDSPQERAAQERAAKERAAKERAAERDAVRAVVVEAVDAVDEARRAQVRTLLDSVYEADALVAAAQAGQVLALAEAARSWACPHRIRASALDAGAGEALADQLAGEHRPPGLRRTGTGVLAGAGGEAGVHEGYLGVCLESIEALTGEVAAAGHRSRASVGADIRAGIRMPLLAPHALAAWSTGRLHARQVHAILDGTERVVDDTLARRVDELLCGPGADQLAVTEKLSGKALAARIAVVVADVDAAALAVASRRATGARRAEVWHRPDGQASLCLTGPAPAVFEMKAALDAAARAGKALAAARNAAGQPSVDPWASDDVDGPADRRGMDAHRFDAAHQMMTQDIRTDPSTDSSRDAGPDPSTDSSRDAGPDPSTDSSRDAGADADADAAEGAGEGATSEAGAPPAPSAAPGQDLLPLPLPIRPEPVPPSMAGRGLGRGIELLVGLATLLGDNDAPAYLAGYGPVDAWVPRAMAAHRPLTRFMTHPLTGALVHLDGHTFPAGTLNGLDLNVPGGLARAFTRPGDGDGDGDGDGGADPPPDPPDFPGGRGPGPGPGPDPGGRGPGPRPGHGPGRGAGDACRPVDPGDCPVRQAGIAAALAHGLSLAEITGPGPVPGVSGRYTPSPALDRHVRRVWDTCTHPAGCWRPARESDLDHVQPWPLGTTCSCNLAPLCERDHLAKHGTPRFGGGSAAAWASRSGTLPWPWTVWRCTDGHQHWRSPLGVEHVTSPPVPLPALRPTAPSTPGIPAAHPPARPLITHALAPLGYPRDLSTWRPTTTPATGGAPTAPARPWPTGDDHPPF